MVMEMAIGAVAEKLETQSIDQNSSTDATALGTVRGIICKYITVMEHGMLRCPNAA